MMKEEKLAFEIKMLDNMISRKLFDECKKNKITLISHVQGNIIKYLYVNKNKNISQSDLEKEINVRRSTMSGILDTMEKNELIRRIPSKNDARKKQIVLTDKTLQKHKQLKKSAFDFEKMISKNIPNEDIEAFFRVVNKIKENIMEDKND